MNFPTEFFTWETLATLGGAAVAVFTVVQMTKALLPHWLPVRIYAWFWGWVVLSGAALAAGHFTWPALLINVFNGGVVALAAMGGYEVAGDMGIAASRSG